MNFNLEVYKWLNGSLPELNFNFVCVFAFFLSLSLEKWGIYQLQKNLRKQ